MCFSTIDSNFSLDVNVNTRPGNRSNPYLGSNDDCKSCCQSPLIHSSFRSCECSWVLNWGFFWPSNKGLHAQSSFSGSLRKAGALFRKDTVRVTSSPALRRTCTWKRNTGRYLEINLWSNGLANVSTSHSFPTPEYNCPEVYCNYIHLRRNQDLKLAMSLSMLFLATHTFNGVSGTLASCISTGLTCAVAELALWNYSAK